MVAEYIDEHFPDWVKVESKTELSDENKSKLVVFYWNQLKNKTLNARLNCGKQLIYQIPNNSVLTSKIGLLVSLRSYDRYLSGQPMVMSWHMNYRTFFPETFRLDIRDERMQFLEDYVDGQVWISKPTALNRGRGIYLIRCRDDIEALKERLESRDKRIASGRVNTEISGRIVQRYVCYPMLLNRRKFDVRAYMLLYQTSRGLMAFYRSGYCRLSLNEYDADDTEDLTTHLTNQSLQKKDPKYEEEKDETVWSMEEFNTYMNTNYSSLDKLPENWVMTSFNEKCKQIAAHCVAAVKSRLDPRVGFFDLIGVDYLVDEDFRVFLLEMNTNPALSTNCSKLQDIIPSVVQETLDISFELFSYGTEDKPIRLPLRSQNAFRSIYNATKSSGGTTPWKVQNNLTVSSSTTEILNTLNTLK